MKILEENENLLSIYSKSSNLKHTAEATINSKSKDNENQIHRNKSMSLHEVKQNNSNKATSIEKIKNNTDYPNMSKTMNLSNKNPNQVNVNHVLIEEEADSKELENEKVLILKSLEDKSERLAQLENEIKELNDIIKIYDNKINIEDRNWAKKVVLLERNIDTLNKMYQEVVTQKNMVKCENKILNKKVKLKNDCIALLEKEVNDAKESIKLKDEKSLRQTLKVNNNLVKVIKGGC
jgi:hypothetical protein